jgi:hypothetical protein
VAQEAGTVAGTEDEPPDGAAVAVHARVVPMALARLLSTPLTSPGRNVEPFELVAWTRPKLTTLPLGSGKAAAGTDTANAGQQMRPPTGVTPRAPARSALGRPPEASHELRVKGHTLMKNCGLKGKDALNGLQMARSGAEKSADIRSDRNHRNYCHEWAQGDYLRTFFSGF